MGLGSCCTFAAGLAKWEGAEDLTRQKKQPQPDCLGINQPKFNNFVPISSQDVYAVGANQSVI